MVHHEVHKVEHYVIYHKVHNVYTRYTISF
jgi:hypothetical protein